MTSTSRTFFTILAALLLPVDGEVILADSPTANADKNVTDVAWPFFAFDNGVGRDDGWKPQQQAELTSQLGYDGIGYSRVEDLDARFAACDAHGQRIFSFYESFTLGEDDPVSPRVSQNLSELEGKHAILWLNVQGTATEEEAIVSFRKHADKAGRHGVRVAIYPHANTYVETGRHALRLAQAVNRKNFGMSINVCHELKAGKGDDLVDLARDSIEHLFLVSVNGADRVDQPQRETGWSRLIQPLGEGDFDLRPFLTQLRASGYEGPIGLQCYQVKGKTDALLEKSLRVWREMVAVVGGVEPVE